MLIIVALHDAGVHAHVLALLRRRSQASRPVTGRKSLSGSSA
jgi:hypothetical protein